MTAHELGIPIRHLGLSLLVHLGALVLFAWPIWVGTGSGGRPRRIEFKIIESETPKTLPRKRAPRARGQALPRPATEAPPPPSQVHEPTNAHPGALTSGYGEGGIPVPVADYEVNELPELLEDVRVGYPDGARQRRAQGTVVMDLLIDASGVVREALLAEGPDPDLNDAAMEAARRFRFNPALAMGKPVAMRIRYAYRFVLEEDR